MVTVDEVRDLALSLASSDGALWIDGDDTRLAQVLANLLRNAAKFTRPGGRVSVDVRRDGPAAVIAVRDTGSGISAEVLARLFQPFTQADRSLDRSSGGLGLGLALVRGIVELHGGEVRASSDGPERGTEITIRLPLAGAEPSRDEARAAAGP